MVLQAITFPTTKSGWFETTIPINNKDITIGYEYDLMFKNYKFSIENNGVKLNDLYCKSAMPMNYSMKNVHDFLVFSYNICKTNPMGYADEFERGINKLFIADEEGYKYFLNNILNNEGN